MTIKRKSPTSEDRARARTLKACAQSAQSIADTLGNISAPSDITKHMAALARGLERECRAIYVAGRDDELVEGLAAALYEAAGMGGKDRRSWGDPSLDRITTARRLSTHDYYRKMAGEAIDFLTSLDALSVD